MTRIMKWILVPAVLLIGFAVLPASQANAGWGISVGGYPYAATPYAYYPPAYGGYYANPYAAYTAPYPYVTSYATTPFIGLNFGGYGGYGGYRPYYGHHHHHW